MLRNGYRQLIENNDKEIGVAIGSNGEILHFSHGKHRLAIAQFLKLEKVFVKVRIINPNWYIKNANLLHGISGKSLDSLLSEYLLAN